MAKTVTIGGGKRHLSVSDEHLSPLCGAVDPRLALGVAKGDREAVDGDVNCKECKRIFKKAVANLLA